MISVSQRVSAASTARWYSVSSMAILGSPCPASAAAFASSVASVSASLRARLRQARKNGGYPTVDDPKRAPR
jgi:hypothetical protein